MVIPEQGEFLMWEPSSGYNLPPGCFEHHLPGNRPEDALWEQLVDEIDDDDIITCCKENQENCDDAQWHDSVESGDSSFLECGIGITCVENGEYQIVHTTEFVDCPFVKNLLQSRFKSRQAGDDDPRNEPEYWEDR
jgi:hypothetical protein